MALRVTRRGFLAGSGALALTQAVPTLAAAPSALAVVDLRTEFVERPLGVETMRPQLSWRLEATRRGVRQTEYRVRVASSPEQLRAGAADLWDSGEIRSDASTGIVYAGTTLHSRQRCWWQVQVRDDQGRQAESPPTFWEMGLLDATEWRSGWLAAETPAMRADREAGLHWIAAPDGAASAKFGLPLSVAAAGRATLIVAATGTLKLWLDGTPLDFHQHANVFVAVASASQLEFDLPAGTHWLAASVDVSEMPPGPERPAAEFAALLRWQTGSEPAVRTTTQHWQVSTSTADDWYRPGAPGDWQPVVPGRQTRQPWPPQCAVLMRRAFHLDKPVARARLYITALGSYAAQIDGVPIGDGQLAPESTDFRKRALYRVHDVTPLLTGTEHVLGVTVGDGWYASSITPGGRYAFGPAPRRLIAQLEIEHADGTHTVIGGDADWKLAESAVRKSEIYDGEDYDARLEQPAWSQPGFDDWDWAPAQSADAPPCELRAQIAPPIRRQQTLRARRITQLAPGVHVFDFGQNFAGWCRLRVKGPAGRTVSLRFAEILKADGDIDQSNLRSARAADFYTLRGDAGGEVYEPRFTYHGFRYVQVQGFPGTPTSADVLGIVVHSDLPETGRLQIDQPLIQRLWQNTLWSQRSNFVGIPTDCPQRDERLGWMGDANVFWDAAAFNMDVAAFTQRFMGDVRDAQTAPGAFADFAPMSVPLTPTGAAPGWADAGVTLPWTVWKRYGDTGIVDANWVAMDRYQQYILQHNPDHVWRQLRGSDYADWLALDARQPGDATTPKELVGTATWAHSADCMAQMAQATRRDADATAYRALHARIVEAFQAAFIGADGTIGNGSQTGYILALRYGLVPDTLRPVAAARLVADIRRRGTLLSTGFLGTPNSLDVLADAGEDALVYELLLRTDYPSWGYMIAKGATTIWERWNGDTGDIAMNSYNHYALGAVCGFLFRRIAGIDTEDAGFGKIVVRPLLDPRVPRGGGEYDSVRGRIATQWTQRRGGLDFELTVPPNASARVHLPAAASARILEGRREVRESGSGSRLIARTAREAVIETGSGHYRFSVR